MTLGRRPAGRLPAARAWLAARTDEQVFAACLAGIALAVGAFLVAPLAPQFVSLHRVPTNLDYTVVAKPQGEVTAFWVLAVGSFGCAVWQWRLGRRPSARLLVAGVALLTLLALLVPPVASDDVYAYSFYGKVQSTYHANPYLSFPEQHTSDPWYHLWSWRLTGPVYGPPFLLLLRLVAAAAGPSLLAFVVAMKLLLTAAVLLAVGLLARAVAGDPAAGGDPRWPVLLIAWNPMVLQAVAMSAHVDALLLLVVALAVLAHRRGRRLATFLLLILAFLVKVYLGPLAALYALWLAFAGTPGRSLARRLARLAGLGGLGVAVTALAYLPYASAGTRLFTSALDVSDHFSTGSPPNLLRRALAAVLPLFGVVDTSAAGIGIQVARQAAVAAILVAFVLAARAVVRAADPWPPVAGWLLAYLLLTPWVFYWHELPLLGLVAVIPWGVTSLVAVVLSLTLVPMVPRLYGVGGPGAGPSAARELANTTVGLLDRYGGALAALGLGLAARRRAAARAAHPGPEAGRAPTPARVTSRR